MKRKHSIAYKIFLAIIVSSAVVAFAGLIMLDASGAAERPQGRAAETAPHQTADPDSGANAAPPSTHPSARGQSPQSQSKIQPQSPPASPAPMTKAEATDYKATSRLSDVMDFIKELQLRSPLIRVEKLCVTAEGREVPIMIIGHPVPAGPDSLRNDKRGVIYIQANIHAGEVEGKEASLMLARDIILADKVPYLDRLVLVIVPDLNADGNERIDPKNRTHQPGPAEGVGVRTNGLNMDLNRDSMKLESPELAGVMKNIYLRWDPLVYVDCHTTNGSYHKEVVTYSWNINPNGDVALTKYMSDVMMPAVDAIMEKTYNTLSCGYGGFRDFKEPQKGWETLDPQPRYTTNYYGLRNRLSVLDENYVYADFKTRVLGNYYLLKAVCDFAYDHLDEIKKLIAEADMRTVERGFNPAETDQFGVEFDVRPLKDPITIHPYVTEVLEQKEGQRPRLKPTDKSTTETVPYYSEFFPKRTVRFPAGYLIKDIEPEAVRKLLQHGILVERLREPATLEVQAFQIKEIKAAERLYQGHRTNAVKGEYTMEKRTFPAGTYFVTTAQPLGNLAAYMLEPESDDGLLVWNYLDKFLALGFGGSTGPCPVYKLLKPVNLAKDTVK